MVQNLVVLELNELNFEMMKEYASAGAMPNFKSFLEAHGYAETTSESNYAELEPWIQWVTVHTGKPLSEHRVFRLGDVDRLNVPQIWEQLESMGLSVGAISPINAANRLSNAAYFVPDPWTKTPTHGSWVLRQLVSGLAQAVNDNAKSHLTPQSAVRLFLGIAAFARPVNYLKYLQLLIGAVRRPWNKVLFLDLFLADLFITLNHATQPNFSTIFLNGGAHLQHHYMFNSKAYRGGNENPKWYIGCDSDPVGDIYRLYDSLIGQVQKCLPNSRMMIVTGLHQDPTERSKYYWRLRDHASVLKRLGLEFRSVDPRMSRDFLVSFDSVEDKARAFQLLSSATIDGDRAFSVDVRDDSDDLFVEFVYSVDVARNAVLAAAGGKEIENFRNEVAFVALKNGQHSGIGYFADSSRWRGTMPKSMPLAGVYREILGAFSPFATQTGEPEMASSNA